MLRLALAVVLTLCFVPSAFAQRLVFGPQGEAAKTYVLTPLVSLDGETKNQFLGRVGRFMTNYTQNNTFEACASVCRAPNAAKWGVVVSTNESVLACATVDTCPEGMSMTQESIHSHPEPGRYQLSRNDATFLRARKDRHVRGKIFDVRAPSGFSVFDKVNGPGYLVENGVLSYYDGQQTHNLGPVAAKVHPNSP